MEKLQFKVGDIVVLISGCLPDLIGVAAIVVHKKEYFNGTFDYSSIPVEDFTVVKINGSIRTWETKHFRKLTALEKALK